MITLIIVLIIVGVALSFIPLDPGIRNIIVAVIAIAALLAVLSLLGVLPAFHTRMQ
jgi:hypothetical protein